MHSNALRSWGLVYAHHDDYAKATELFRKALRIDRNDTTTAVLLSAVLWLQKSEDEAVSLLEDVIAKEPYNALAIAELGWCYTQSNRVDKGIELLRTSVSIFPGRPHMHAYLAAALMSHKQQYEEASYHYEKAKELGADMPWTQENWTAGALRRINFFGMNEKRPEGGVEVELAMVYFAWGMEL